MVKAKRCIYKFCGNDSRYPNRWPRPNIRFYPFPKPTRSRGKSILWLDACGRSNDLATEDIKQNHFVCSEHFSNCDGPTDDSPNPIPYCTPNTPISRPNKSIPNRVRQQSQSIKEENIEGATFPLLEGLLTTSGNPESSIQESAIKDLSNSIHIEPENTQEEGTTKGKEIQTSMMYMGYTVTVLSETNLDNEDTCTMDYCELSTISDENQNYEEALANNIAYSDRQIELLLKQNLPKGWLGRKIGNSVVLIKWDEQTNTTFLSLTVNRGDDGLLSGTLKAYHRELCEQEIRAMANCMLSCQSADSIRQVLVFLQSDTILCSGITDSDLIEVFKQRINRDEIGQLFLKMNRLFSLDCHCLTTSRKISGRCAACRSLTALLCKVTKRRKQALEGECIRACATNAYLTREELTAKLKRERAKVNSMKVQIAKMRMKLYMKNRKDPDLD